MDTSSKCRRRSAACRAVSAVCATHFEGEDAPGLIIPPLRGFREGEVARRAGGVMSTTANAHDPSVRCADTSPRKAWGGNGMLWWTRVSILLARVSAGIRHNIAQFCQAPG